VRFGPGADGGWELHAAGLDKAEGAVVERALGAARDDLFPDTGAPGGAPEAGEVSWADALVRLAEAALERLDPDTEAGRPASQRYLVNLHLRAEEPWAGVHLGPVLPAHLRQRVGCDAQVRLWVADHTGTVNLGRRQRVVDPRLRTVIEHRDQGCVVPGCGTTRHLVIHHLVHWEHGGRTDTPNLVALCRAHHRAVHDGQVRFTGDPDAGTLTCRDRTGRPLGPVEVVPPGDPHTGATGLDLPTNGWTPRAGERADCHWIAWTDPPPAPPPPPAHPPDDRTRSA
jgi:hypothetical protein